jgi:hypothetical protein
MTTQTDRLSFWQGYLACACVSSLLQDLIGKEAYIQAVSKHWIDSSITLPLAVIGLIAILRYRYRNNL